MSKKLIVFTTLIKSKMGGFKDLAVLLGKKKEVEEINREYQKRKFLGPWGLKELAKLYRGISIEKLKELSLSYCQKNLIKGAKEFLSKLKKKSFSIGALSANPQFIMDALAKILPLDFSEGTQLEFRKGKTTGKIIKEVNRYVKAEILKEKRKIFGLKRENVIVIGDPSVSYLPMVKEARVFIIFDPTKENFEDIDRIITENVDLQKIFY